MYLAKTKALISFAVAAKLICVFVFAYAKIRFSLCRGSEGNHTVVPDGMSPSMRPRSGPNNFFIVS